MSLWSEQRLHNTGSAYAACGRSRATGASGRELGCTAPLNLTHPVR